MHTVYSMVSCILAQNQWKAKSGESKIGQAPSWQHWIVYIRVVFQRLSLPSTIDHCTSPHLRQQTREEESRRSDGILHKFCYQAAHHRLPVNP